MHLNFDVRPVYPLSITLRTTGLGPTKASSLTALRPCYFLKYIGFVGEKSTEKSWGTNDLERELYNRHKPSQSASPIPPHRGNAHPSTQQEVSHALSGVQQPGI